MQIAVTPGRRLMGRLGKGEDLLLALEKRCIEAGIQLGAVKAIGAVSRARFGYYDQTERKYAFLEMKQPLEILALLGNVSLKDGKVMVHAHVTLADAQGRAWGGHLAEGTLVFACEFEIQEYSGEKPLSRAWDEETGLFLWPQKQWAVSSYRGARGRHD
jgi:predicted DNA-binding protein with PD1-like motif